MNYFETSGADVLAGHPRDKTCVALEPRCLQSRAEQCHRPRERVDPSQHRQIRQNATSLLAAVHVRASLRSEPHSVGCEEAR